MKRSVQADLEKFHRELENYRSTLADLHLHQDGQQKTSSLLDKQITFWMESARFSINELEVWGRLSETAKYDLTATKLQKILDHVNELITQLVEEQDGDLDSDEEID